MPAMRQRRWPSCRTGWRCAPSSRCPAKPGPLAAQVPTSQRQRRAAATGCATTTTSHGACNFAVPAGRPEPVVRLLPADAHPAGPVGARRTASAGTASRSPSAACSTRWRKLGLRLGRAARRRARRAGVRIPGRPAGPAGGDRPLRGRDHAQRRRSRRRRTRAAPRGAARAVSHAARAPAARVGPLLLGPAGGQGGRIDAFRAMFGDERADYAQALDAYYAAGGARPGLAGATT